MNNFCGHESYGALDRDLPFKAELSGKTSLVT